MFPLEPPCIRYLRCKTTDLMCHRYQVLGKWTTFKCGFEFWSPDVKGNFGIPTSAYIFPKCAAPFWPPDLPWSHTTKRIICICAFLPKASVTRHILIASWYSRQLNEQASPMLMTLLLGILTEGEGLWAFIFIFLESLELKKFNVGLITFRNNPILLNKISHRFLIKTKLYTKRNIITVFRT